MVDRVKTGIPGMDSLIEGGIPKGFAIFLSGPPGSGKSIFGLQFLWEGVKKGERCLYVSLEQNPENLYKQALQFGMDFGKYEKSIQFLSYTLEGELKTDIMKNVYSAISQFKATRLVFDSLSAYIDFAIPKLMKQPYFTNVGTKVGSRYITHLLLENLSKMPGLTSLLVNEETDEGSVAEFLADGVVSLRQYAVGEEMSRQLSVPKMRLTNNDSSQHLFDISKAGISLKSSGLTD